MANYKAITASFVISKLSEFILNLRRECLISDALKFGFKVGVGYAEAI